MTKTLTEKWKDRELKEGEYYCKITESPYIERVHLPCLGDVEFMIEVLAPVPSYEELREKEVIYNTTSRCNETLLWENESLKNKVEQLQKQNAGLSQKVHILNEANEKNYNALCDEIKKNNKLQEQLKEENDCINSAQISLKGYMLKIHEYKKKWGLK